MVSNLSLPLFIKVESGTDSETRLTLNPLFVLITLLETWRMQAIAEMFGLGGSKWLKL